MTRLLLLALASALAWPAAAAHPGAAEFSADERARIASHGPWPASAPRDPSNRVSGLDTAIALGRRLFSDPRLSANAQLSCASCHSPEHGFSDGRKRARGLGEHDRNTQSLFDLAWQRWFGWDGGADSLWAASIRPMLAAHEMGSSPARLAALVRADPQLRRAYTALFGAPDDDDAVTVGLAKAIAAYLETLVSAPAAFDRFRDALARDDRAALAAYPDAARRGLKIFLGRGNCALCHVGARFTNGEFHDVGMRFIVAQGRVDPGRHAGVRRVKADRFNLLSAFNDQRAEGTPLEVSLRTRTVILAHRNWGEWKTPGLRNLRSSAPYMHDGSLATLRDVVRHYSELDVDRLHADGEAILRPLRLTEAEIDDLVAFLETLSP
ncbi:MAG: hypothetical protein KJZ83_18020 [Burkholderiaceae bacterium]|nr:hypothetical protein [Burkholderiaceae bacterium]